MTTPAPNSPAATYERFGHTPVTVSDLVGFGGQLMTGIGLITAVTFLNYETGSPSSVILYDGGSTAGTPLAVIGAPGGGGGGYGIGLPGIYFCHGLYSSVVSGQMAVTVTYVPLTEPLR